MSKLMDWLFFTLVLVVGMSLGNSIAMYSYGQDYMRIRGEYEESMHHFKQKTKQCYRIARLSND